MAPPPVSAAANDRAAVLRELRRLTGDRPRPQVGPLAQTGIAPLDEALGGGLPKGRLSEIVGRRSSGRTAVALSALARATARGETVALVDVDGVLDARGAEAAGIDLARMLWVHAGSVAHGMKAADLVLKAGGFGVVALDVGEAPARAPDSAWLRLARAAERSGAALVVVSPRAQAGTFATILLETARARPVFAGRGAGPRVLRGVEGAAEVVRSKLGARPEAVRIALTLR